VVPPTLVHADPPQYPAGGDGRSIEFELGLTIDKDGAVIDAQVIRRNPEDAGEEFDAAALTAARAARFQPAQRDGVAIPVRIGYRVHVAPPHLDVIAAPAASTAAPDGNAGPRAGAPAQVVGGAASRAGASSANAGGGAASAPGGESAASPASAAALEASGSAASHMDAPAQVAGAAPSAGASVQSAGGAALLAAGSGGELPPMAAGGEPAATEEFGATARSRTLTPPPARAASDFFVPVGRLREVPRANASDFLKLAPGVMLTNEGGEGHAERVYLRGFDAGEGQDIEFTVDGVPINEVGNPHSEGYADTHFILPELVRAVRVVEGPFDPHQGNYAVAGSADYVLGLEQRGMTVSAQAGSFDTQRLMLLWGPERERTQTFVGADVRRTAGFGQNRAAELARALGQYELSLGGARMLRVLATSYATRFGTAGVVRADDWQAGRIGFYDTYDPTQGGDAQRHGLSIVFEEKHDDWALRQQLFLTQRDLRLRDNFTGFLEDPPEPYRSGSAQRGDMTDQNYSALTLGARGSLRETRTWLGLPQSLELGYFARHDDIDASQRRLRFKTVVPYRVDFDYSHAITNIALYADTELAFTRWLHLRGGLRAELFEYDTLDRCALHDTVIPATTPQLDQLCYDRDRVGPRDPTSRRSSSGLAASPRGTLTVGPFAGASVVGAVGRGARAADPSYLGDGDRAPFASVFAAEGGMVWNRDEGGIALNVRGLYYYTHVGQDLIFDQQEGRNTLAPGTIRQGLLLAARAHGSFFDVSASGTYAHARFERDDTVDNTGYRPADAGDRVPYIPDWVARLDGAVFHQLPGLSLWDQPLHARASLGVSYVSPRALLFGERGQPTFVTDLAGGVSVGAIELGVVIQNLFDSQYRLAEYNYVSEFRPDPVAPNLLPVRHFTAGAPRTVLFTLTLHLGGRAGGAT
jgi:TonB family protein